MNYIERRGEILEFDPDRPRKSRERRRLRHVGLIDIQQAQVMRENNLWVASLRPQRFNIVAPIRSGVEIESNGSCEQYYPVRMAMQPWRDARSESPILRIIAFANILRMQPLIDS